MTDVITDRLNLTCLSTSSAITQFYPSFLILSIENLFPHRQNLIDHFVDEIWMKLRLKGKRFLNSSRPELLKTSAIMFNSCKVFSVSDIANGI